jgi:hypothetical protein
MEITKNFKVWMLLVLFTVVAVISSSERSIYPIALVLGLAFVKFIGVGFFFMEVKRAHSCYKIFIVLFCLVLFSIFYLL